MVDTPKGMDYDYVFFIDDDLGGEEEEMWSMETVRFEGKEIRLPIVIKYMKQILDHDLNICGGLYCKRTPPYLPLVTRVVSTIDGEDFTESWVDHPKKGLHEVATVPTGFLAIKKKVFDRFKQEFAWKQRIVDRYKKERATGEYRPPGWLDEYLEICTAQLLPPFWVEYYYNQFDKEWGCRGEDVFFCREAKKLGFKVHCDFAVQLPHMTTSFIRPDIFAEKYKDHMLKAQEALLKKITEETSIKEVAK